MAQNVPFYWNKLCSIAVRNAGVNRIRRIAAAIIKSRPDPQLALSRQVGRDRALFILEPHENL